MASLPSGIAQSPDDEDQKRQQGAPLLSGGGAAGAGAPVPGSTSAPKQSGTPGMGIDQSQRSSMQPQGSGYINLQSYMTPTVAGQNQQKVAGMGADLTGKVQGAFDAADTADRAAIGSNAAKTTNYWDLAGLANKAGGGDKAATDQLGGLLTQKYAGPAGSTFDAAGNADYQHMAKLSGAGTALDALNPEMKGANGLLKPTVSQGGNWLDQAMIQGDAGTLGEIKRVDEGGGALAKFMAGKQEETGRLATDTAAAVDKARDDARGVAQNYIDVTKAQSEQDARSANAARDAILARGASRDWGSNIASIDDPGKRAEAGNFLDKNTAGGLNALAGFMGDPSLGATSTGPYRAPTYTQGVRPNAPQTFADSPLEYSDTFKRDDNGNWTNSATGESFDATWDFNPQTWTFKNVLTGETKSAGRVFKPTYDPNALDPTHGGDLQRSPTSFWQSELTNQGNTNEYQRRRKKAGK